jgi:hypothetical protein
MLLCNIRVVGGNDEPTDVRIDNGYIGNGVAKKR